MMQKESLSEIAIAVVYFEKDVELAAFLAKSIERFGARELVAEIVFLDNSSDPQAGRLAFENQILPQFNELASRVRYERLVDPKVDFSRKMDSYYSQQALKLEVSRVVTHPYYLVLDTKNHLIKKLTREHLFDGEGKPRSHWANHTGYLRTCLNKSLEYFGVSLPEEAQSLPTITPYLMVTDIVRDMLDDIQRRGEGTVLEVIQTQDKRTEFLLYCGYLLKTVGNFDLYAMGPKSCATLFARWPQEDKVVQRVLETVRQPGVYALGIHSRRFAQLSEQQADHIIDIWIQSGLVPDRETGRRFIRDRAAEFPVPGSDKLTTKPHNTVEERAQVVYEGRNGRLFINEGTNKTLQQHIGTVGLSGSEITRWRHVLEMRQAHCAVRGREYAMLVAPDTHAIHAEDIPELDGRDVLRPVRQIQAELGDESRFVYPLDALRQARGDALVCHMADSHWSGYGAFVAYEAFVDAIPFPLHRLQRSEVQWFDKSGPGDLGDRFDPPRLGNYTECVVRNPAARMIWNNGVSNRGYQAYWETAHNDRPRGLLLMDSYGWKMQRFLVESFSSMYVVHSPFYEFEAVENFQPDIVINLMAERFLLRVPNDLSGPSAFVSAREKAGRKVDVDWRMIERVENC